MTKMIYDEILQQKIAIMIANGEKISNIRKQLAIKQDNIYGAMRVLCARENINSNTALITRLAVRRGWVTNIHPRNIKI